MGEVRVKAKLTNAGDESLVRRGMLKPEQVRTCEADALVDAGAVRTVLPPEVVSRLGLGVRGQLVAEYADGRKEAVSLTEPLFVELAGRDTVDEAIVLGDEVLIGQTWRSSISSSIVRADGSSPILPIRTRPSRR
jgi:hypothetical protein